jgi:hypothetical protein
VSGGPCFLSRRVRREVFYVWAGLARTRILSLPIAALRVVHGEGESEEGRF